MSDSTIVYTIFFMAFVLLVVMMKLLSFRGKKIESKSLMYYRLDFAKQDITLINEVFLEEDTSKLNTNGYGLIFLPDLEAFMNGKSELSANVFFIAINENYSYSLKIALPALIKSHRSIIIFIPAIVKSDRNIYQKKQTRQLNEYIFSDEFKNIFFDTQPNSSFTATIQ